MPAADPACISRECRNRPSCVHARRHQRALAERSSVRPAPSTTGSPRSRISDAVQKGRQVADERGLGAVRARHGDGTEDDQGLLPQRPTVTARYTSSCRRTCACIFGCAIAGPSSGAGTPMWLRPTRRIAGAIWRSLPSSLPGAGRGRRCACAAPRRPRPITADPQPHSMTNDQPSVRSFAVSPTGALQWRSACGNCGNCGNRRSGHPTRRPLRAMITKGTDGRAQKAASRQLHDGPEVAQRRRASGSPSTKLRARPRRTRPHVRECRAGTAETPASSTLMSAEDDDVASDAPEIVGDWRSTTAGVASEASALRLATRPAPPPSEHRARCPRTAPHPGGERLGRARSSARQTPRRARRCDPPAGRARRGQKPA